MVDRLINTRENAQRIARVEVSFGGDNAFSSILSNASLSLLSTPNNGQQASNQASCLAAPGRVLVGEGVLTKVCRKRLKRRQFFLFNDILVYGTIVSQGGSNGISRGATTGTNTPKYIRPHVIPLEEVKLETLASENEGGTVASTPPCQSNGWLIKTRAKSFAVYAATPTEKLDWMSHIDKCVRDLLLKTGKCASQVHAAVWIPDSNATVCMACKKTAFNLINRRHHCRNCGSVVCGPCSTHRLLLPHISQSKQVRVCSVCHLNSSSELRGVVCEVKSIRPLSLISTASDLASINFEEKRESSIDSVSTVGKETPNPTKDTTTKDVTDNGREESDSNSSDSDDDEIEVVTAVNEKEEEGGEKKKEKDMNTSPHTPSAPVEDDSDSAIESVTNFYSSTNQQEDATTDVATQDKENK